jgi:hypothetical protein
VKAGLHAPPFQPFNFVPDFGADLLRQRLAVEDYGHVSLDSNLEAQEENPKPQTPTNESNPNNPKKTVFRLGFGSWSLGFGWDLEFGIWDLSRGALVLDSQLGIGVIAPASRQ